MRLAMVYSNCCQITTAGSLALPLIIVGYVLSHATTSLFI